MKKFFAKIGLGLTATATGALFMAITTTQAHALDVNNPVQSGLYETDFLDIPVHNAAIPQMKYDAPTLRKNSKIAVARLDGGRFIPTPRAEVVDWELLNNRVDMTITEMRASDYWNYIPEIPFQGAQDTRNKIDEIRLTAANGGQDYVLIYGVGPDASWASFGTRALSETGLKISETCGSSPCETWEDAKAKALLVDSFSGEVLGAVTADEVEFNIGQLADRVGEMILDLSA